MSIHLIFAASINNVIGSEGKIPWHIKEDLQRFRDLTMGSTVVMGRKTWDSIPESFKPLKYRKNIVLTKNKDLSIPGVLVYNDSDYILRNHKDEDIWVIGGEQLYKEWIDKADYIYATRVLHEYDGDAYAPYIDPSIWKLVEWNDNETIYMSNGIRYIYQTFDRR